MGGQRVNTWVGSEACIVFGLGPVITKKYCDPVQTVIVLRKKTSEWYRMNYFSIMNQYFNYHEASKLGDPKQAYFRKRCNCDLTSRSPELEHQWLEITKSHNQLLEKKRQDKAAKQKAKRIRAQNSG